MSANAVAAWLFGKLPSHGDFVSRGLALAETNRLDIWLSDEMTCARKMLGDLFHGRFDAAPPWLFMRARQGFWEGGVLCPSVDSAGRRFPLLLARAAPARDDAPHAAETCLEAIYRAFEVGMTADELWRCAAMPGGPVETGIEGSAIGERHVDMVGEGDDWPSAILCRMMEPASI